MGKSQKSAKPYGRATTNWIPQSGIHFSPSLSQAKDHPSINVRKILDTTVYKGVAGGSCQDSSGSEKPEDKLSQQAMMAVACRGVAERDLCK